MSTEVVSDPNSVEPLLRRKTLSAFTPATMRTEIDCGEHGQIVTDEPAAHGGTGKGPSPLQTVLAALTGCESVTFNRTAAEFDFDYESITYEAGFTIDIRGRLGNRSVTQHFQTVVSRRPSSPTNPRSVCAKSSRRPRLDAPSTT